MPKVGDKHFAYTEEGIKKAKAYAKKTGKKVEYGKKKGGKKKKKGYAKGYAHGGSVELDDSPVGIIHTQLMTPQKSLYSPKGTKLASGADPSHAGRGCGTRGMIGFKKSEVV
jgi:hypothetical protein